jgi:hypothetical protein
LAHPVCAIENSDEYLILLRHIAHVSWDQDGGYSQNIYGDEPMDETVRELLKTAGCNPEQMTEADIKFTYDFINKWKRESSGPPAEKGASLCLFQSH